MKRDLLYAVITIVVVVGLCFGLAQMRPDFAPTKSQPFHLDAKSATPEAVIPGAGKIIMRVNGEPVTDREFQLFVSGMPENMQQMLTSPTGRRLMADQIAGLIALAQEGRKMGLQTDSDVSMQLKAEQTNTLAMAALRKMVSADDARLRAEYAQQKGNLEAIELKHILVAYQGGAVPARPGTQPLPLQVAMQKAAQIEAALRSGADFATLARQASDDTGTARQGGDLGPVSHDALPPQITNEVWSMKEGEITKPIRTQYGIHIFKVGPRKSPTFEQVRPQLEAELQQRSAKETVERIKKSANVDLDPSFFGAPLPNATPTRPKNPS